MGTNNAVMTNEMVVTCKNELGALAKCTLALKQANVNIECFCCYTEGNQAKLHFITNNNTKAKDTLAKAGWTTSENPAVRANIGNTPGTLNGATTALSEARVNIDYCYCATPPASATNDIIFSTNDNTKAVNVLNKFFQAKG